MLLLAVGNALAEAPAIECNLLLIDLGKRYAMTPAALAATTATARERMAQDGAAEPLLATLQSLAAIAPPPQLATIEKRAAVFGMMLAVYAADRQTGTPAAAASRRIQEATEGAGLAGLVALYKGLAPSDQIATKAAPLECQQVGAVEWLNHGRARRCRVRVTVPPGLSAEQTADLLAAAAQRLAVSQQARAVMVLAYRSTDANIAATAYTVGLAVYAPRGEWSAAQERHPRKARVYLRPPP